METKKLKVLKKQYFNRCVINKKAYKKYIFDIIYVFIYKVSFE